MKPYELIEDAALLIERTGWTQGRLARDKDGIGVGVPPNPLEEPAACYCAFGSVCATAWKARHTLGIVDVPKFDQEVIDPAVTALNAAATDYGFIAGFNDTPGRTQPEVLALMWRTAVMLRRAEVTPT